MTGKQWKYKGKDHCPFYTTLSGARFQPVEDDDGGRSDAKKMRSECECDSLNAFDSTSDVVDCKIILPSTTLTTTMLVDSGALNGNYVNTELAEEMKRNGIVPVRCNKKVCGAVNGACATVHEKYPLTLTFNNEVTNKKETIHTDATNINTTWPVIIGRPTIKRNNLTSKLPSQFMAETTKIHRKKRHRTAGPQVSPGQSDSSTVVSNPVATVMEDVDEPFVWQELLDFKENVEIAEQSINILREQQKEAWGNAFPWEELCAMNLRQMMGQEDLKNILNTITKSEKNILRPLAKNSREDASHGTRRE